ncbi:MAG: hypothetical protein WC179_07915 [Candidatus Cloacimonadaceae bacterium]
MIDMDFLKFYTQIVEQNFEYKFENKQLVEQVDKLKKLLLSTHLDIYKLKEYPKERFDMSSYNFPISSAKELIQSGFYTKQDLKDYIKECMIEYDIPDYVPRKEE